MIQSTVFEEGVGAVLREGLASTDELLVVNPSPAAIDSLVTTLGDSETHVRLFVDEQPLKDLVDDFLVASVVADLVHAGTLSVRTLDAVPRHSLLLTPDQVVSLVEGDRQVAGLPTDDDEFVTRTYRYYDRAWEGADEYTLRTPPLSQIRETLEADIGPEVVADFDAMLDALETARGNGDGLDEVTVSLLAAAKNEELLYDVSRWGEDVGLASKATFSRTKNQLEGANLVETEKVPIEVGRPRLRLVLGNGIGEDADATRIVERAESTLS